MRYIPAELLKPGMLVARGLKDSENRFILCAGIQLTEKYIERIIERGYAGVYIEDEISRGIEVHDSISPVRYERGIRAIKEQNIGEMVKVAKEIASEILYNEHVSADLISLRSYDDYTYHHSVNVAIYATLMAKRMHFSLNEMEAICTAGICHDIGKCDIDTAIINKPGCLTDEEYEVVKKHAYFSFEKLREIYGLSAVVKQAVLYHHENENGTGYPYGKSGEEIPLFSKILHVVDVYDALTTKRPYKGPYSPSEAIEFIRGAVGTMFDEDVVDVFLSAILAYPPGIDVELSNEERGVVVKHTDQALRPVIRLMETRELINLREDERYENVEIIKSTVLPEFDFVRDIENKAIEREWKTVMLISESGTTIYGGNRAFAGVYAYKAVRTPVQAFAQLNSNPRLDLVVIDVDTESSDVSATIERLREKSINRHLFALIVGTEVPEVMQRRYRAIRNAEFMAKPVPPIYLREWALSLFGESVANGTMERRSVGSEGGPAD